MLYLLSFANNAKWVYGLSPYQFMTKDLAFLHFYQLSRTHTVYTIHLIGLPNGPVALTFSPFDYIY